MSMKRKRYSTKRQLHDLAAILAYKEDWKRLGYYYEFKIYMIQNEKKWITEGQARKLLNLE